MLVLTRRDGEAIVIDEKIVIRVRRMKGKTRVEIEAPRELSVRRRELKPRKEPA